ncbi:MAG: Rieske 2Fe-2S domain-containing protein [Propionibacteriales bacterium]|nr:Rieske 2Fe-2S domain-containing protein [Propionibacteriales bacterium]
MLERWTRTRVPDLERRTVLRGIALTGAGASLLIGCDSGGSTTSGQPEDSATEPPEGDTSGGGGEAVATTGEIPEGGGAVFADAEVVVTQPQAGEFMAFSAICTHQGCTVTDVADGTINCACHGSKFNIEDGSVANGPATDPLPEMSVTVDGDQVMVS